MPSASFSHEAHIEASPATVWASLQTAETWADIGPINEVWDPHHDHDGSLAAYKWSADVGPTTYRGSSLVVVSETDQRMRLDLDSSEVTGALEALLIPNGTGTNIRVTLDIESKGFLATMFFAAVAKAVGNGLPEQVDRFAANLSN